MTAPPGPRPGILGWLAALLIRGPEAAFILVDLDDALAQDVASGMPMWRARWRYAVNILGSAISVWRARWQPSGLRFSWIDVKLGLRMLVRYPGLTGVAVFALAIGIPVGLAPAQFVNAIEAPLPVDEGDRIQLLRYWNVATARADSTMFDEFRRWSETLTTFEALGASRTANYNLGSETSGVSSVAGAEVTASTFAILRAQPLLGRTLVQADEVVGAPSVAVLGHDLWQARFAGDSAVVGRTVHIGGVPHTVVGVMPEEFLFPVRQQLWLPLREQLTGEPRQGLPLAIFGRLSDDASQDAAQIELTAVEYGMNLEFPETYARLEPEVVPTAFIFFPFPKGGLRTQTDFRIAQALTLVPLLVACLNVGLLIFARTATRSGEFAVRTALGANRGRIISQVFTESLVLATVAAGVGLLLISWLPSFVLSSIVAGQSLPLPYWIDLGVTRDTVLWALALSVLSAAVAGVVPALKVTGRSVHRNIQRASAGRSGVRFGGLSGALIVADVATAMAVIGLAAGISNVVKEAWDGRDAVGIQADQFLSVQLGLTRIDTTPDSPASDGLEFRTRLASTQQALIERLKAESGVRAVAVGSALPRMDHDIRRVELDQDSGAGVVWPHRVRSVRVDLDFFDALGHPILAGRAFNAADLSEGASSVIVNTTFVEKLLGGRNPVGARVRYRTRESDAPSSWFEIVGVVGHLGMHVLNPNEDEGLYHPAAPGSIHPLRLAIHVNGDPEAFVPRLRVLAAEVDPLAVISTPMSLDKVFEGDWYLSVALVLGGVLLVGILLALAASGLFALLSFAVTQRTREIGIRVALGADRRSIAFAVVKRSLAQIGAGVILGMPLLALVFVEVFDDLGADYSALAGIGTALALGAGVMLVIGLLACTAPTLRALRIAPTDALKGDS